MIILISQSTDEKALNTLKDDLDSFGLKWQILEGHDHTVIHIPSDTRDIDHRRFYTYPFVEQVHPLSDNLRLSTKKKVTEHVEVPGFIFDGKKPFLIAGPCSVESETQIQEIAKIVKESGAQALRGGAYKPRTSPYAFQGLKEEGLIHLERAARQNGLLTVSEIVSEKHIPLFERHVDIIQVGARNMQNFELLKALGSIKKPILLKRGFANTVEEWLHSAEYILSGGNRNVILCERGIRTFEPWSKHTLDLAGLLAAKNHTHLPVIADPSHAAGDYALVEGLSKAAIAAGADGLMLEIHPDPKRALSDGAQSLKPERYLALMRDIDILCKKG